MNKIFFFLSLFIIFITLKKQVIKLKFNNKFYKIIIIQYLIKFNSNKLLN